MKKVQDYYYKKAKKENYPARSVYKLKEAQQKFHILCKGDRVLDIGCCPGSWAKFAAEEVGSGGFVCGIDLQKTKSLQVRSGAQVEFFQGDIYDDSLMDHLAGLSDFQVVVCDMAPKTTGNKFSDHVRSVDLSRQAFWVACRVLVKDGNFYCKVFEGEDLKAFVDDVKKSFRKVRIFKPKSSRSESREVFVLAMGLLHSSRKV